MASRRLHFGDDDVVTESETESDFHQRISSERGDDLKGTLARVIEHVGSSSRRVCEVVELENTLELNLGDAPVEADVGPIMTSRSRRSQRRWSTEIGLIRARWGIHHLPPLLM